MNKTAEETREFFDFFKRNLKSNNCDVIIFPPAVSICMAKESCQQISVKIGAQNCHQAESGAFTGEISAQMLKSIGTEYVILGHSERRTYFGETNEIINKKVLSALKNGLKVVLCVGESLQIREEKREEEFVTEQLKACLSGIPGNLLSNVIIAYEPMWAIGTGKTVDPSLADKMALTIKKFTQRTFSKDVAVLYGGSVNAQNINDFLSFESIDGALVGGASLNPQSFLDIINSADKMIRSKGD